MVQIFAHAVSGWPKDDQRAVALALIERLEVTALGEVVAAAYERLHREAERRRRAADRALGGDRRARGGTEGKQGQ
jgi:hypothetical protein